MAETANSSKRFRFTIERAGKEKYKEKILEVYNNG